MWDVIYYGELGSSLELLEAGYSIDCLMTRYQGVDWSDKNNWGCNGGCVGCVCKCSILIAFLSGSTPTASTFTMASASTRLR